MGGLAQGLAEYGARIGIALALLVGLDGLFHHLVGIDVVGRRRKGGKQGQDNRQRANEARQEHQ